MDISILNTPDAPTTEELMQLAAYGLDDLFEDFVDMEGSSAHWVNRHLIPCTQSPLRLAAATNDIFADLLKAALLSVESAPMEMADQLQVTDTRLQAIKAWLERQLCGVCGEGEISFQDNDDAPSPMFAWVYSTGTAVVVVMAASERDANLLATKHGVADGITPHCLKSDGEVVVVSPPTHNHHNRQDMANWRIL